MKKILTLVLGFGLFGLSFSLKGAAKAVKATKLEQRSKANKRKDYCYGFQLDYCFKDAGMEKNFGKQENPAKIDYENFNLFELQNKTNVNHALALYVMVKEVLSESLNENIKKDLEFKLENLVTFNFTIFKNLGVLGTTSWPGICSEKELLEYEKILKLENLKKVKIDKNKLDEAKKEIILKLNESVKMYEELKEKKNIENYENYKNYKNKIREIENAKLEDVKKAAKDLKQCRVRVEKKASVGNEFTYFC